MEPSLVRARSYVGLGMCVLALTGAVVVAVCLALSIAPTPSGLAIPPLLVYSRMVFREMIGP